MKTVEATPKEKVIRAYASPAVENSRTNRTTKAASADESPNPRNWRAEVHQNSRKASAFIETGDKLSIKSPVVDAYETSEFMSLKPTKLDLTGEAVEKVQ